MAKLRSVLVPEEGFFTSIGSSIFNQPFLFFSARATVMNYFRIPLNLIVVVILMKVSSWSFD